MANPTFKLDFEGSKLEIPGMDTSYNNFIQMWKLEHKLKYVSLASQLSTERCWWSVQSTEKPQEFRLKNITFTLAASLYWPNCTQAHPQLLLNYLSTLLRSGYWGACFFSNRLFFQLLAIVDVDDGNRGWSLTFHARNSRLSKMCDHGIVNIK